MIQASSIIFRFINIFAIIGYLLNIIGMFTAWSADAADIVNGVFHLFFLVGLLYIEVDQNSVISRYVPFLFSFVGRGIFYIWLSWTTFRVEVISVIGTIFTFVVGVIYVLLFILKNIQVPAHMSFDEANANEIFFTEEGRVFLPTHNNDCTGDNNQSKQPEGFASSTIV